MLCTILVDGQLLLHCMIPSLSLSLHRMMLAWLLGTGQPLMLSSPCYVANSLLLVLPSCKPLKIDCCDHGVM